MLGRSANPTLTLAALAVAALSSLAFVPSVSGSSNVSGQGTFVLTSGSFTNCTPVPNTNLLTCTLTATGATYGTISGPWTEVATATFSSTTGSPTGGPLFVTGIRTCNPCTVAGLTGSLTLAMNINIPDLTTSTFQAQMSITGGSGGLAGVSGSGTFMHAFDSVASPYSLAITLP